MNDPNSYYSHYTVFRPEFDRLLGGISRHPFLQSYENPEGLQTFKGAFAPREYESEHILLSSKWNRAIYSTTTYF